MREHSRSARAIAERWWDSHQAACARRAVEASSREGANRQARPRGRFLPCAMDLRADGGRPAPRGSAGNGVIAREQREDQRCEADEPHASEQRNGALFHASTSRERAGVTLTVLGAHSKLASSVDASCCSSTLPLGTSSGQRLGGHPFISSSLRPLRSSLFHHPSAPAIIDLRPTAPVRPTPWRCAAGGAAGRRVQRLVRPCEEKTTSFWSRSPACSRRGSRFSIVHGAGQT